VTPAELITAMLKSEVELLWFGGIGTYVKAGHETHADAGDRANDGLRIDAAELQAKVIGEGANLGMTQSARIEYGFKGGRCNTDSIDNSAGVDCSDHEVNIKILLGDIEAAGDMTRKQRDQLLEKMTDEVADLVLRDNYLQTQGITVTHQLGAHLMDRIARFMRALERAGDLDRAVEHLPDDEIVAERQKQNIGFARPEISVLQSYAKIVLYDELLSSDLPDDPYMNDDLVDYFPTPLRTSYRKQIGQHRLRREIIATVVTNELVNRVGLTFIHEVKEKTGMPAEDIARAYIISREIFGIPEMWRQIEALDNKAPAAAQSGMLMECGRLIERETVWFLREAARPLDIKGEIEAFGAGVAELIDGLPELLSQADLDGITQRAGGLIDQGVSDDLARRIAGLALLAPACDIVRIAAGAGQPVRQAAKTYFDIGARFGFDWLRRAAGHLPTDTAWDKLAVTAVIDDLFGHQGELTQRVLETAGDGGTGGVIDDWAEARRPMVARTEQLLAELQSTGVPDFAMLAVANRQLKTMVGG
jgi:glutamate dehydrogenase